MKTSRKTIKFKKSIIYKILIWMLVLFLPEIFTGCLDVPEDMIMPEWEVDLNIPVLNRTYTMDEIIKPQENITIDTTENIFILQSGVYNSATSLSEFMHINESSTLENVPIITSQTDSFSVFVQFPEGLEVDSGELAAGEINLTVNNPLAQDVSVLLGLPAFRDQSGNPVVLQSYITGGNSGSVYYQLNGFRYEIPEDQPAELRNCFRIVVRAYSQQEGGIVYTGLSISDLTFNYVSGMMPAKSLGNKVSVYDFDIYEIEDYRDKSFLQDAKLKVKADYLSMFNTPNVMEIKNLNIIGRRNDGTQFYLRDRQDSPDFSIRMLNGSSEVVFDESNSNVTDFISFFPDSLVLRGEYIINPENSNGTFSSFDSVRFETDFSTKSYLALRSTFVDDESSIQIDEDERESIRNSKAANLNIEVENGIPLNASLKIDFLDQDKNYLFTLTDYQSSDTISFAGANTGENGETIEPYLNPVKIILLSESQLQLFSYAHYISYQINFSTKGSAFNPPQIVTIRPSDWINVKLYGSVRYNVETGD